MLLSFAVAQAIISNRNRKNSPTLKQIAFVAITSILFLIPNLIPFQVSIATIIIAAALLTVTSKRMTPAYSKATRWIVSVIIGIFCIAFAAFPLIIAKSYVI